METIAYDYNDSQWGDLLTSYDGDTITYDAMGNPTSYLGKTLTWEGKQLEQVDKIIGDQLIRYSFAYDENGLRTKKQIFSSDTGTTQTVNYCYNGSVLIGMSRGSIVMRFSYDASGSVVAVDYSTNNGSSFTTYYYVRNAQNDIVKLIDGSGNTVVEYTYDSWGKSISVTGTLATTLGADQPFRYRGYVYDTETEWYYLQSRYYDTTTCRFISADVLLSTGQGVIGHNSFAYCLNDPLIHHDPAGTWSRNNSDKSNVNDGGSGFFGTFTGWARRTFNIKTGSSNSTGSSYKYGVKPAGDWFGYSRRYSCPYQSGYGKAPQYKPDLSNGVYEKINTKGNLLSRAYYDEFGYQYLRIDYQGRAHCGYEQHIHLTGHNNKGFIIYERVYSFDWILIDKK